MVRLCKGFVSALLCATVTLTWAAEPVYQSKALSPQHVRELQQGIHDCVAKVNATADADERACCQEELCKALLQAEDYDKAIRVAEAIYRTPKVNEERRAVAHYLIAEVQTRKTEASPTLELMEQNRRLALENIESVLAGKYPEKWMVNDSARRLRADLQDPSWNREVQARVVKRQSGGLNVQHLATAYQAGYDPMPVNREGAKVSFSRVSESNPGGAVNITRNDFSRTNRAPLSNGPRIPNAQTEVGVQRAVNKARLLSEPIVIDGMGIRKPRVKTDTEKIADAAARSEDQSVSKR